MTSQGDEPFPGARDSDSPEPCARCDYDLRGVRNDQPCPECGLLAERSRGFATHLSDAKPGWLLNIAIGTALILLAHLIAAVWTYFVVIYGGRPLYQRIDHNMPPSVAAYVDAVDLMISVYDVAALILFTGVWLLTRPQRRVGRAASEDRVIRTCLRLAATVPLISLAWEHAVERSRGAWINIYFIAFVLLMIALATLPALGFIYLRRLAQRVLHPGLAEHAAIVGVGLSVTMLVVPVLVWIIGTYFANAGGRSIWLIILPLLLVVPPILFGGWSALNCGRFIIAFLRAYCGARRKWAAADRAGAS